jgi:hypothetical protein
MKFLLPVLAAVFVAASAHAATKKVVSLPPLPTTPPGSSVILIGTDSVQKELKLTSLQRAVLRDIRDEYRDSARAITASVTAGKKTKKQGFAKLQSLTASSERRAMRVLNDTQKQRLEQIRFHLLGGYMLLKPALQTKLGLTDLQKSKIEKIWVRGETYASKVNTWYEEGKISFYERLLYHRENRLDRSDDIVALLTPDQHATFEKLKGTDFAKQ